MFVSARILFLLTVAGRQPLVDLVEKADLRSLLVTVRSLALMPLPSVKLTFVARGRLSSS